MASSSKRTVEECVEGTSEDHSRAKRRRNCSSTVHDVATIGASDASDDFDLQAFLASLDNVPISDCDVATTSEPITSESLDDLFDDSLFDQLAQTYSVADPQISSGIPPATSSEDTHLDSVGDLVDLLDISQLSTQSEIATRFSRIAQALLHDYRIEISSSKVVAEQLELLEIEFYLYKSGCHEDPFTHASPEQSQYGRWYFHRPPSRTHDPASVVAPTSGYRGGTRKGLDITIGQPPPLITSKYFSPPSEDSALRTIGVLRGGILLRSARRVSDKKVFAGPAIVVNEILRLSGAPNIAELVAVNWHSDISAFEEHSAQATSPGPYIPGQRAPNRLSTMYLVRAPAQSASTLSTAPRSDKDSFVNGKLRIFSSPRIGLDASHPSVPSSPISAVLAHPRVSFVTKSYRFFVRPYLLITNGRAQTFVGLHDALVAHGHCQNDGELLAECFRLGSMQGATAEKYLREYRKGLEGGSVEEWVGPGGKNVTFCIGAWLRMIGTLRKLMEDSNTA